MTREETIKIFNTVLFFGKCDCPKEEIEECLKMAIKALEQEPCEDCISRQAVINGIDNYIEKVQSTGAKDDFISFEELVVKALPPVTSQEPIIDKIRAEIEQTVSRYSISRERDGMGQVEWSDRLIKESEVLKILDKYKESEVEK